MPIDPDGRSRSLQLCSDGPDETRAIAAALAPVLAVGDVLVLTGDLGAGKTCFTQGLGAGLGIDEPITSPTFTLANRYRGRLTLHHLDAYRLAGEADAGDLDLEELIETGITVIEWGDRIAGLLPPERFALSFHYPDLEGDASADDQDRALDRRRIEIEGPGDGRRWAEALARWTAEASR